MSKHEKKNGLERTILWISVLLVAATLVFLIFEAITEQAVSPDIAISCGRMEVKGGYYALPVKVTNTGTETAENVHIEITIGTGDNAEKSEIEFQYLPGQSSVKGWTTFRQKAAREDIQTRVLGYVVP